MPGVTAAETRSPSPFFWGPLVPPPSLPAGVRVQRSKISRRKWLIAHGVTVAGVFTEMRSSNADPAHLYLSYGCCTQNDETN
jgi:hypothetical protein